MTQKSLTTYLINTAMIMSMTFPAAGGQIMKEPPLLKHDVFGHGSEQVIVLHSWMGDAKSFDLVKPYLNTDRYTYVFADLRGYGRSSDIFGEYSLDEASGDVLRLADSLGWQNFHLVGHSMSGMIVQRLMIDDAMGGTRRIQSVVAVTPVTADGYPADKETRKFLWDLIHNEALTEQGMAGLTGQRLLPKWSRLQTQQHIASSKPEAMRNYFHMWMDTDISAEAAASHVATPIRVIGGRQDLPGFQEEKYQSTFAVWYPHVDMQFITDAGHFPMYETPVYLATLLEGFLDQHNRQVASLSDARPEK